jgi:hypothetical protein
VKVHELISFLYTLEPELEVMISGYEGGYNEVKGVSGTTEYVKNVNDEWYYGPHEQLQYQLELGLMTQEEVQQKGTFKGVMIY